MMLYLVVSAIIAVLFSFTVLAGPNNPIHVQTLIKEVDDAENAYLKAPSAESEKLWNAYSKLNDRHFQKIFEITRQNPDSPDAFSPLQWIATNRRINIPALWTNALEALDLLSKHHASNTTLGPLCGHIRRFHAWRWNEKGITNFLHTLVVENPSRSVRGNALMTLAILSAVKADELMFIESLPAACVEDAETNDHAAIQQAGGIAAASAEAVGLLKDVIEQYGDCDNLQKDGIRKSKPTLAEEAQAELFELTRLSTGQTAPEISGCDLDNGSLKLSNHSGRIVLLSFWASWCGPCVEMVATERALAERMAGKPFSIVGVNGDSKLEDALKAVRQEKMTWKSFSSEGKGPHSRIATDWNIHGWPTTYVLDAKGVIRLKLKGFGRGTERQLNEKIEELIKEQSSGPAIPA